MLSSDIPSKVPLPFADTGTKNVIPTASQIGITPGAASLTDGFPPLTMTPIAAGGIPPAGADFNGILNLITAVQQWQSAGGIFKYDAAFSTAIGGYPAGAVLMADDDKNLWLNLADNNTTDPDGASPTNWGTLASYGMTAVTGLTNANVTLTPAQYSKPVITLAGTLTGNVQIIFPNNQPRCLVINNTTGAFTVTCKTAAGTGATVDQGGIQEFNGDGPNLSSGLGDNRYAKLSGLATQAFSALTQLASDASSYVATTSWAKVGIASVFGADGYFKFPDWMGAWIIQWGNVAQSSLAVGTYTITVTYSVTFPSNTYVFIPVATCGGFIAGANSGLILTSAANLNLWNNAGAPISLGAFWLAIGK